MAVGIDRLPVQESCATLPTFQPEALATTQAPVTDGGFLYALDANGVWGRRYPIDEETGQPHLVMQVPIEARNADGELPTYHHDFYYWHDKHLGGGTNDFPEQLDYRQVLGLFVRVSSGVYLRRALHEVIHDNSRFPIGPNRPTYVDKKIEQGVAGVVGIRPRLVLDMSKPVGQELQSVDRQTWERTADPEFVGIERFRHPAKLAKAQRIVGNALFRYVAVRDLSHVSDSLKDNFINEPEGTDNKRDWGYDILWQGIEAAVDPFLPRLNALWSQGLVQPGREEPMKELQKLILHKSVDYVVPLLHQRIARQTKSRPKRKAA